MPVRIRFRCQFCDTPPAAEAQRSLERGLQELVFGEYTISQRPWKMPPYPTSRRSRDTDLAIARGGLSAMPKWGLPS